MFCVYAYIYICTVYIYIYTVYVDICKYIMYNPKKYVWYIMHCISLVKNVCVCVHTYNIYIYIHTIACIYIYITHKYHCDLPIQQVPPVQTSRSMPHPPPIGTSRAAHGSCRRYPPAMLISALNDSPPSLGKFTTGESWIFDDWYQTSMYMYIYILYIYIYIYSRLSYIISSQLGNGDLIHLQQQVPYVDLGFGR